MIRITLWWGGPLGVANTRPATATDPADPAYDWRPYDRTVRAAAAAGIRVMFTILGTPAWASGSAAWNRAPQDAADLEAFAAAAARRYDGTFNPGGAASVAAHGCGTGRPGTSRTTPCSSDPSTRGSAPPGSCRAHAPTHASAMPVVAGLKTDSVSKPLVACGVTAPRGNNQAGAARASVSPVVFLRAMRAAGARGFDAYAHHPYYGFPRARRRRPRRPTALPGSRPPQ